MKRLAMVFLVVLSVGLFAGTVSRATSPDYSWTNLVSDIPGVARFSDDNLINPWGLAFSPTGPFWVANADTGTATVYDANGAAFPPAAPIIVTIPKPGSATGGAPSGQVFNGTPDFVVSSGAGSGPARFIFATEDGTIVGWNPAANPTSGIIAKDNSASGAIYKGLAIGNNGQGNFLYAANFHAGVVEMYDKDFNQVKTFTDTNVDLGFAPFGVQTIDGKLYVTFALQDALAEDDVPGPGNGYVDEFDMNGNLLRRIASHGTLDSPWGLALAPDNFGVFRRKLLVGNFGDGRINAFDPVSTAFSGQLTGTNGNPLAFSGLWSLQFGSSATPAIRNQLFFTAGLADETHGLFGVIKAGP